MSKLAFVVALLALGVGGFAVYGQQGVRDDLAAVSEGQQTLDGRLLAIERALTELQRAPAAGELLVGTAPASAPVPAGPDAGPALSGAARPPARPVSVEQRLAQLESALAAAGQPGTKTSGAQTLEFGDDAAPMTFSFGGRGFLGSVDQASKTLSLDASQRAGLERTVEDVKRELAGLHERPNDEGVTMKQLQAGWKPEDSFGEDGMAGLHEHMAKVARFRASKVPGSSETYAQAERRIRKDGKGRARSYLNADQAKTWDKSHTDGLFGGGDHMGASVMVMDSAPVIEFAGPTVK